MQIIRGFDLSEQSREALMNELELRFRFLDYPAGLAVGPDEVVVIARLDQALKGCAGHKQHLSEATRGGEPEEGTALEWDALMRVHARPARQSRSKSSRAS